MSSSGRSALRLPTAYSRGSTTIAWRSMLSRGAASQFVTSTQYRSPRSHISASGMPTETRTTSRMPSGSWFSPTSDGFRTIGAPHASCSVRRTPSVHSSA